MKIGAAYIRVSTDMQIELSPESQLKAIKEYANSHDIILSNEFIFQDDGISGRKAEKRPGFMNMIAMAKSKPKPFDVILIWKFSRFARNREDSIVYKSMLRKQCGIDVISISEQLSEDKTSILIEALLEAMDEYYSINLAEEVKRGMTEKASRGGVVSAPPFGYVMNNGKFTADPERAEIVRQIFSKFISGERTLAIAKWLNSMGVTTRQGKPFANRTVEYILTNPVYTGKIRWNTDGRATATSRYNATENTIIVDSSHEAIIAQSDFDKAQELVALMKQKYPKHASQAAAEYMLKGLVRCNSCGATLTASAQGKGLQCYRYSHGQCDTSHYISLSRINNSVLSALEHDLMSGQVLVKRTPKKSEKNTDYYETQLKKERSKLERVKKAYENGIDTIDEYRENKKKILDSINAIEAQLEECSAPQEIYVNIRDKIAHAYEIATNPSVSEELKNSALREIIDNITFDASNKAIEIFYK